MSRATRIYRGDEPLDEELADALGAEFGNFEWEAIPTLVHGSFGADAVLVAPPRPQSKPEMCCTIGEPLARLSGRTVGEVVPVDEWLDLHLVYECGLSPRTSRARKPKPRTKIYNSEARNKQVLRTPGKAA